MLERAEREDGEAKEVAGKADREGRSGVSECSGLAGCLDACDVFALYVAAIGHDVGHPGFTNGFMVSLCFFVLICATCQFF